MAGHAPVAHNRKVKEARTVGEKFNPANLHKLLDPDRRLWNDPDKVLQYLNLGQCTVLADIGCGPGWFTIPAAQKMAPSGFVYAIDLSPEMLDVLRQRCAQAGLHNVQPVLAEEEDEWPVPSESCEAALVANVYHEVDPTSGFLSELKRILKPGGIVLLVEWKREPTPVGPPLEERLDQQDVTEEFTQAGFILFGTCDVGPYHYGLKFYCRREANEPMNTLNDVVP